MLRILAELDQYSDYQFSSTEASVLKAELAKLIQQLGKKQIPEPPLYVDSDLCPLAEGMPLGFDGLQDWASSLTKIIDNGISNQGDLWAIGD